MIVNWVRGGSLELPFYREINKATLWFILNREKHMDSYDKLADLKKFSQIDEFQQKLADKFFDYYGEVFKEGALTAREKSLIALAVSHTIQCPYCIDAYTTDSLEKG